VPIRRTAADARPGAYLAQCHGVRTSAVEQCGGLVEQGSARGGGGLDATHSSPTLVDIVI
jgi:hypothetical protein